MAKPTIKDFSIGNRNEHLAARRQKIPEATQNQLRVIHVFKDEPHYDDVESFIGFKTFKIRLYDFRTAIRM
ncbi:hypothetical protein D9M68_992410 [compost metagenome]